MLMAAEDSKGKHVPAPFENPQLDVTDLPAADQATFTPLSPQRAWIETVYLSAGFILPLILAASVISLAGAMADVLTRWPLIFLGIMALSAIITWLHFEARARAYALRKHDILYRSGILFRTLKAIALNRIQHVEVKRPYVDRKLGLATLLVYTAGASGADLTIAGLSQETAMALQAHLLKRIAAEIFVDDTHAD